MKVEKKEDLESETTVIDLEYKKNNSSEVKNGSEAGWIKLDFTSSKAVEIVVLRNDEKELKEDELELPQFIALSNEPKTNDKIVVHKIARGKPITIRRSEEDLYMKYPFEQKYFLSLKSLYNK